MRNLEEKSLKIGRQKFSWTNTRKYFRGGIQELRWPRASNSLCTPLTRRLQIFNLTKTCTKLPPLQLLYCRETRISRICLNYITLSRVWSYARHYNPTGIRSRSTQSASNQICIMIRLIDKPPIFFTKAKRQPPTHSLHPPSTFVRSSLSCNSTSIRPNGAHCCYGIVLACFHCFELCVSNALAMSIK